MYVSTVARSLGAVDLPSDWRTICGSVNQGARGGLLRDCLKTAGYTGTMGEAVSQAQLNLLSSAYQKIRHPNWLTSRLGEAPPFDPLNIPAALPKNPVTTPTAKFITQTYGTTELIPQVSASTLLAAAGLPNAPTVVKQAAAQLQSSQGAMSGIMDFMSQEIISGTGITYWYVAGGLAALLVFGILKGGRR